MLVLTRRLNEVIMIGDHIRIRILETQHDRVRIGIEAPANMRVHRFEVAESHEVFATEGELPPSQAEGIAGVPSR